MEMKKKEFPCATLPVVAAYRLRLCPIENDIINRRLDNVYTITHPHLFYSLKKTCKKKGKFNMALCIVNSPNSLSFSCATARI